MRCAPRLLLFARAANDALAELGFPLCPGDIMAAQPGVLPRPAQEWRERFAGWIREPTPEALLGANIFFDFRALYGNHALADGLRAWISGVTPENRLFQRMLVANALQAEPPLGRIRTFRTDDGEHAGTIDLKAHGTRIFVDAARAFALALGIAGHEYLAAAAARGPQARHRRARDRLRGRGLPFPADAAAARAAGSAGERSGRTRRASARTAANRIDPYALNDLDQRMLKEAFRQARALQQRLEQTIGQ